MYRKFHNDNIFVKTTACVVYLYQETNEEGKLFFLKKSILSAEAQQGRIFWNKKYLETAKKGAGNPLTNQLIWCGLDAFSFFVSANQKASIKSARLGAHLNADWLIP